MFGKRWMRNRLNQGRSAEAVFRLNHWKLVYWGEKIAAEGHLHGRPGYPEGVEIRTSMISSWEMEGEEILLHTANSTYRCALSEYKWSDDSIELLKSLNRGPDGGIVRVREMILHKREEMNRRYSELAGESSLKDCTILRWHGCDLPYIQCVITCVDGTVEMDDLLYSGAEIRCSVTLGGSMELAVTPGNETAQDFHRFGGAGLPVFVENSGDTEIKASLGGKRSVTVKPGEIVRVP